MDADFRSDDLVLNGFATRPIGTRMRSARAAQGR
jgi:hypothetical protein